MKRADLAERHTTMTTTIPTIDPNRPLAFKGHLTPHVVPGEAVYLLSEKHVSVLDGKLAPAVAVLVDGTHTAADIRAELAGAISAERVDTALAKLFERMLIGYADAPVDRSAAAYFQLGGTDGDAAADRLRAARVSVRAIGTARPDALLRSLDRLGVSAELSDSSQPGALGIVLTDDYLRPELADYNRTALRENRQWLLARAGGTELWIGPWFAPSETGCWTCLAHRLEANQQAQSYLRQRAADNGTVLPGVAGLPVADDLVAHLIAVELARHAGGLTELPACWCSTPSPCRPNTTS
jgi:hypothetical protein